MDAGSFIEKWRRSGGAERANYQLFIADLCALLGVDPPDPQRSENAFNDYVFERTVQRPRDDGGTVANYIDCYKRGCFVLEAKQATDRAGQPGDGDRPFLPGMADAVAAAGRRSGTAVRGTGGWDTSMRKARNQAEAYARYLPTDHGYPPFLIVVDVGNTIELWADFSGLGKRYDPYPDRRGFRIDLDALADPAVQDRLRRVWVDPMSLDPSRRSAEVTREVAERLARVAALLENRRPHTGGAAPSETAPAGRGHDPHTVATFLMRCLFTMFAEDTGLLPEGCFTGLLRDQAESPETFPHALGDLWRAMNGGGYTGTINAVVKRFNGWLFRDSTALPLPADAIRELAMAAAKDWRDVEPAIFGTLLERALDPRERHRLGAHYTPRAYVERLVEPTVMDPLWEDWAVHQARAKALADEGKQAEARAVVHRFHKQLCETRVLDPACGTGNFLYVALELMKKLEGEVLDTLAELGETQTTLLIEGHTVHPTRFLGLEINPRAVEIAHLVVWLGYLKWQIRTHGLASVEDPVLSATDHILEGDAVLAHGPRELVRDADGRPLSRWDGQSYRLDPVTGEKVPDETARREIYRYPNPRAPAWPEAEFIVGNPPFIGGKDIRRELGEGYVEALWAAHPEMPRAADYVTYWWDRAARLLTAKGTKLRRFGLITTNSIVQTFSRRVLDRHLSAKRPLHLVFAVADHPWLKAQDRAAVRIAMTVAAPGPGEGKLGRVLSETGLDTDSPVVELETRSGAIRANLRLGADLSQVVPLKANDGLSSRGVSLHGSGFIVTPAQARDLGLGTVPGLENHIRPYVNGRDIAQRPRGVMVIDLYDLTEAEVQQRFPKVYEWVLTRVKPERNNNNMPFRKNYWWWFGATHRDYRSFTKDLEFYFVTPETKKHQYFSYIGGFFRADNMLVSFGLSNSIFFSTLTSRLHSIWSLRMGGRLGVGNDPRYNKTRCFDPFPFPDPADLSDALVERLRDLGARLDRHRKDRQAAHPHLTLTGMYNVLERVRGLEHGTETDPLTPAERDIADAAAIGTLKHLHDEIDRSVFGAYGWSDLADRLVGRPGATLPLDDPPADQAAAEEELLSRLVALNRERAAEERAGKVRWLRPAYQKPLFGVRDDAAAPAPDQAGLDLPILLPGSGDRPPWPTDPLEQIRWVRAAVDRADGPVDPDRLLAGFRGRATANRRGQIARVLETLTALGQLSADGTGRYLRG